MKNIVSKTTLVWIILLILAISLFYFYKVRDSKISINGIEYFISSERCIKNPSFIKDKIGNYQVAIDLTQSSVIGMSLRYNTEEGQKVYVDNSWKNKGAFREYTRDKDGNLYLTPIIFLEASTNVFKAQSSIYKVDTETGNLNKFITIENNQGSKKNPYGLTSIAYDCGSNSIFVGSLSGSTKKNEMGTIYQVDLKSKEVLSQYNNYDALSLVVVNDEKGNGYILSGSAKKNGVYIFKLSKNRRIIKKQKPLLIETPARKSKSFDKIYKIRVAGNNTFILKGVEFNYAALASTNSERNFYTMIFDSLKSKFIVTEAISENNLINKKN